MCSAVRLSAAQAFSKRLDNHLTLLDFNPESHFTSIIFKFFSPNNHSSALNFFNGMVDTFCFA